MTETAILIIAILLSDGTHYQEEREYTGYFARSTCLWDAKHLKDIWGKRDDVDYFMASCPMRFDAAGEHWTL